MKERRLYKRRSRQEKAVLEAHILQACIPKTVFRTSYRKGVSNGGTLQKSIQGVCRDNGELHTGYLRLNLDPLKAPVIP